MPEVIIAVLALLPLFIAEVMVAIKLRNRYITWLPFAISGVLSTMWFVAIYMTEPDIILGRLLLMTAGMAVVLVAISFLIRPKSMRRERPRVN